MERKGYEAIDNLAEDRLSMGTTMMMILEEEGRYYNYYSDDKSQLFRVNTSTEPITPPRTIKRQYSPSHRLASLDVFRGLTVALMILVDEAGGILPSINHSPWNGVTLADFVVPFFLFMVGVSIGLAYKKLSCKYVASKKAFLRALKLLVVGLFVQGGFFHGTNDLSYGVSITRIRWMGVLQRIAIAYLVAALCEIWLTDDDANVTSKGSFFSKYKIQWALAFLLTTVYLALLYGLYVPDWDYQVIDKDSSKTITFSVKCGVRGDTSPGCNAAGMIDRTLLGINHLYSKPIYARTKQCSTMSPKNGPLPPNAPSWCRAPFDPEGLLSTLMAIVTSLIGLHFGHIILRFKDHGVRVSHWLITAFALLLKGLLLNFTGIHVNKALYSLSYTFVTAGVAGVLFAALYVLVDVYKYRRPTLVLEWIGKHALAIYVIVACNIWLLVVQGFYWEEPHNNILKLVGIKK